jgi:ABC-type multidrug transport system fused ATPase/permease subunit
MIVLVLLLSASIALQLIGPQLLRVFIDAVQAGGVAAVLLRAALIFLAIVIAQRGADIATTYVSRTVAWTATNALRGDLLAHVLRLELAFHHMHTPGELAERIDGDVDRLAGFFSELFLQIVSGVLLTVGVLVLLYGEDWRLGALLTLFVGVYVLIHVRGQQIAAPAWAKERQYSAELLGFVEERIGGAVDLHTSGAIPHTLHRFFGLIRQRTWQALRADVLTDVGWTISKIFFDLGTVAAMGLGAYLYLAGHLTLGTVYLVIHYLGLINGPLDRIADQLEELQQARIALERVRTLLATAPRICDGSGAPLPIGQPLAVEFDGVTFGYTDAVPTVRNISFALEPGQTLGLIGRTGSGKSTLARLLFRLYEVDYGQIRLAGRDIRDLRLADLRARIGLVTQEVQIFPASMRDNLTLFDSAVSDEAIWASVAALGLTGWMQGLPAGLDTNLTAGGGLSAGEAQLVALARVFLKDPGVVILDEASSRLDPATERLLERALDRLLAGRTTIVIAHRLATVRRADQILLLDGGAVQEYGLYETLAGDPGSRFARLLQMAQVEHLTLDEALGQTPAIAPQPTFAHEEVCA